MALDEITKISEGRLTIPLKMKLNSVENEEAGIVIPMK